MQFRRTNTKYAEREIRKIEQQTAKAMDRIMVEEDSSLIARYEDRIRALEKKKIILDEKMQQTEHKLPSFEDTFRTALEFLGNPYKLWASGVFEDQVATLKLVVTDKIAYVRNEGFRTIQTTFQGLTGLFRR